MIDAQAQAVFDKILRHPTLLDGMLETLRQAGYRTSKDVMKHGYPFAEGEAKFRVTVMDTETTSLDPESGDIIQLSMTSIETDGVRPINPGNVRTWSSYNDPGHELSEETVSITGITTDMVRGHRIDQQSAARFLKDTRVVIAHNAAFDRVFAEKRLPEVGFRDYAWGCSQKNVTWGTFGNGHGEKLINLATAHGFCYDAHNADPDVRALCFLLAEERDGVTPLTQIMDAVSTGMHYVLLPRSPFDKKDMMNASPHFFFNGDNDALNIQERLWVAKVNLENAREVAAIVKAVYGREKTLDVLPDSPLVRFSRRSMPLMANSFSTESPEESMAEILGSHARDTRPTQGSLLLDDDKQDIIPF